MKMIERKAIFFLVIKFVFFIPLTMSKQIDLNKMVEELDENLCDGQTDCASCTTTVKSDGQSYCKWHNDFGFCGTGKCGLVDCGSDTCQEDGSIDCYGLSSCEECLANDCARAFRSCVPTCSLFQDVPCYERDSFGENTSVADMCLSIMVEELDRNICDAPTDCASCTDTLKSNGIHRCEWYAEYGFCGTGECGFVGCGSDTCEEEENENDLSQADAPIDCSALSSCEECLENDCARAFRSCVPSCDSFQDVPCYNKNSFEEDDTVDEMCSSIMVEERDENICDVQTDCTSCTDTLKSNGMHNCKWYEDYGFCGTGACGLAGCGSDTCRGNPLNPDFCPTNEPKEGDPCPDLTPGFCHFNEFACGGSIAETTSYFNHWYCSGGVFWVIEGDFFC